MMKYFKMAVVLSSTCLAAPAFAGDQSCEVIVVDAIENETQDSVMAATRFLSGDEFIASIYDDEDGYVKTAEGLPIRAVMCRRDNIIPTLRDVPLLQTGLSLSLSQDFDAADSGLLTIYDDGEDYKAKYSGPPLTEVEEAELSDMLTVFDLQRLVKNDAPKEDVQKDVIEETDVAMEKTAEETPVEILEEK